LETLLSFVLFSRKTKILPLETPHKNLHTKTTECERFTTQHIKHKIQWASVATRSTRDAPRAVNSNRGEKLESASRFYVRVLSYLYTFFFLSRKSFWTLVRFRGKMMVSSVKKRGLRIRNARGSRRSVAQMRVKVVEMNARAFDSRVYVFSRWIVRSRSGRLSLFFIIIARRDGNFRFWLSVVLSLLLLSS